VTGLSVNIEANAPEAWNEIWYREGADGWRAGAGALGPVYERIAQLLPGEARVIDLGGGAGDLGAVLSARGAHVTVLDHSIAAVGLARSRGLAAEVWNAQTGIPLLDHDVVVSTEFLEHLSAEHRDALLEDCSISDKPAFLSVPNNRLGPEEEAQHTIKWTAKEFLTYLKGYWSNVRVECIGGYLLGVCGFPKAFTLSVTFPARDEGHDIERVLASFRGVADQLVVGIDPRSADRTEEIAGWYADEVFTITKPQADLLGEDNVHFANIRNQCIERCTGDWIFMTEAHESLGSGVDELLALDTLPDHVKVAMVMRRGCGGRYRAQDGQESFNYVQRWLFPWLWKASEGFRFARAKHNILDFDPGKVPTMWLPTVQTYHDRHEDNARQRAGQRKSHNRKDLFDDWRSTGSENSLYYLASEWRGVDAERTIRYFQQLLAMPAHNGQRRYQARLILAKELINHRKDYQEARAVLLGCTGEDWSRIDHWIFLGDMAAIQHKYEEAIQFYLYAASRWMDMPLTIWWIDEAFYTWLPCERLASCYAAVGDLENALLWAKRAKQSLPADTPTTIIQSHDANIRQIEETLNGNHESCS